LPRCAFQTVSPVACARECFVRGDSTSGRRVTIALLPNEGDLMKGGYLDQHETAGLIWIGQGRGGTGPLTLVTTNVTSFHSFGSLGEVESELIFWQDLGDRKRESGGSMFDKHSKCDSFWCFVIESTAEQQGYKARASGTFIESPKYETSHFDACRHQQTR
jgi:hypothetical protein